MIKIYLVYIRTEDNITGPNIAVIGLCDVENNQIYTSYPLQVVFDSESTLDFDKAITSRKKSKVKTTLGTYTFDGNLNRRKDCNFIFIADILKGKWKIYHPTERKSGFIVSFFSQDIDLVLTRISCD